MSSRGARRSGDQDGADDEVGSFDRVHDRMAVGIEGGDVLGHDIVEVAKAIEVDIEDSNVGAQAGGDFRGVGADDATAQDGDVGGGDSGHAGEEDAAAFLGPFEEFRALLDAHSPGDLAHRGQERQVAACVAQGLVGDCGDAAFEDRVG